METVIAEGGVGTVFRGEGAGTVFRGEGAEYGVSVVLHGGTVCFDSNLSPAACDWTAVSSRTAFSSECIVGPCVCVAFLLGRLVAAVVRGFALAAPKRVARRALVSAPVGCGQGRDGQGGDGLSVPCRHPRADTEKCKHSILHDSKHLWKVTLRSRPTCTRTHRLTSGWMKELSEFCSCGTAFLLFAAIASPSPALFLVLL